MPGMIDLSNNRENMAYVGAKPWHGLGQELEPGRPLEEWKRAAGLDFHYRLAPVEFTTEDHVTCTSPTHRVVYRDDTRAPLATVSNRYHLVQPETILEFFRELIDLHGFQLETAGSLRGGSVVWALAHTGLDFSIGRDEMRQYALLMTSCDATLATRATLTSVRVVCWNTLSAALKRDAADLVVVRHTQDFDGDMVRRNLGLVTESWDDFATAATAMSQTKLKDTDVKAAILRIFGDPERPVDDQPNQRAMARVLNLYNGHAKGADLPSANGTTWGLLNAVTEYVDHHAPQRTEGGRLASAWTGPGAQTKRKAFDVCAELAA